MRPRFVGAVALFGVAGWTLAVTAGPHPSEQEAMNYMRVFAAALGVMVGLLTLFASGLAIGSRWVAEPAARKIMAEHLAALHEPLVKEVATLASDLRALRVSLRAGGTANEAPSGGGE